MSQYSNSGIRENHARLSPMSKKAVRKILSDSRMTYCLHNVNSNEASFCGDGVVQDGEVLHNFLHNRYFCKNRLHIYIYQMSNK